MHKRHTTALVTIGFAGAALFPAALAGASNHSPATTPAGDYCSAHLALEGAIANEEPDDDQAAAEAALAAAPEEIADALTAAIETSPTDGPPTPEFFEAYGAVIDWVRDNCGFGHLEVIAQDYSFGGIGGEVPAGPTVVDLVNEGTEYHEIVFMRRGDDVTMPIEELLELPEEEAGEMVTFVGAAFAAPGATGSTVVDLTPGEYIGICFIPVGSTEEAMAEMMAAAGSAPPDSLAGPGTAPVDTTMDDNTQDTAADDTTAGSAAPGDSMAPGEMGPPHFAEGMIVEFTVVDDGETADGSAPGTAADGSGTTAGDDATGAPETTSGDSMSETTSGDSAPETTTS